MKHAWLLAVFLAIAPIVAYGQQCVGDCNANGRITIADLVTAVTVVMGDAPPSMCPSIFCNPEPGPLVNCLVQAVNGIFVGGCDDEMMP